MAIGGFAAYASDTDESLSQRGYGNMMERSAEYFEDDNITEEQKNRLKSHYDEMDEFHKENGFEGEHCHDRESNGKFGHGMRKFGNNMMRRNNK